MTVSREASRSSDITPASSKDDIISASLELIDSQAQQVQRLEEQQSILMVASALFFGLSFLH